MVDELYQKALLRLAANASGAGTLNNPDAEITLDNPTCGDRVTVQLMIDGDHITDFAHETRACMLCQASISMIAQYIKGLSVDDLISVRQNLEDLITKNKETNDTNWKELISFEAVAEHKSRHFCVLLPFDALIEALNARLQ